MGYYVIKKSEKSISQPYYFLLKAANHETIATSEMYSGKDAAKNGIASVQKMVAQTIFVTRQADAKINIP